MVVTRERDSSRCTCGCMIFFACRMVFFPSFFLRTYATIPTKDLVW